MILAPPCRKTHPDTHAECERARGHDGAHVYIDRVRHEVVAWIDQAAPERAA